MNRERILHFLNVFLNDVNSQEVELMYGKGSIIKFNSVSETISSSRKALIFDVSVVFGEKVDEEFFETDLLDILTTEFIHQFDSKIKIILVVKWDV